MGADSGVLGVFREHGSDPRIDHKLEQGSVDPALFRVLVSMEGSQSERSLLSLHQLRQFHTSGPRILVLNAQKHTQAINSASVSRQYSPAYVSYVDCPHWSLIDSVG